MDPRPRPNSRATRATLLLRLKADQPEREVAWAEFLRIYSPVIGGFARKLGVPQQDIYDIVQEVTLGFFAAQPVFVYNPQHGRFRGYLKTCTWRVVQRRTGRKLQFSGIPVDEIDVEDVRIEHVWNDIWEIERLNRAVDEVRAQYQSNPDQARTFKAFEMAALLEMPVSQIAIELKTSPQNVHKARSRIKQAIAQKIEELKRLEG